MRTKVTDDGRGMAAALSLIGLIQDVPTCAELIARIVEDCCAHLRAAAAMAAA